MQFPGSDDPGGGLSRVHRLATELAARMRYAQMVERPIPPEQVAALVSAARLLHERGEPWPALVGEVLQQVADDLTEGPGAEPTAGDQASRRGPAGLTRIFGAFRRERGPVSET